MQYKLFTNYILIIKGFSQVRVVKKIFNLTFKTELFKTELTYLNFRKKNIMLNFSLKAFSSLLMFGKLTLTNFVLKLLNIL